MRLVIILAVTVMVSAIGTVAYVSLAHIQEHPDKSKKVPREDSCGPKSLWYATERMGVALPTTQLDSFFFDGSFGGTALADLEMAAEHFGLPSKVVTCDWDQLVKHDGTAILFVEGNHFVTADPREREVGEAVITNSIRIYDAKRAAAIWLTRTEMDSIWDGDALLLSKRNREHDSGPIFSADYTLQDVGLLRDPLEVNYRFPVRNDGNKALTLKVRGTSCTCTTATFTSQTLEPGDDGFLDVVFSLKSKEGRFGGLVVAETNDPQRRNVSFHLRGAVYRTNLLSTQSLLLGKIDPGSRVSSAIVAFDPGDGRLKITDVRSELTTPVSDSPSQPQCRITVTPYDEVEAAIRESHKLTVFDSLITMDIASPADCAPGNFEFNCVVSTNLENAPSFNVLVQGTVLPDLVAEPQAIILKMPDDKQSVDALFTIRSRSGTGIADLRCTMNGQLSLTSEHCAYYAASVTLKLKVALREKTTAGWNDGSLLCTLGDGRVIEIPFLVTGAKQNQ